MRDALRDALFVGLTSLFTALTLNLLNKSVALQEASLQEASSGETIALGETFALFGFFCAGTVIVNCGLLAAARPDLRMFGPGGGTPTKLSLWLIVAGTVALGYLIAVVGPNGLGPGITDTFDSGLAPCFYIALYYWAARKHAAQTGQTPPKITHRICWGVPLVLCGLIVMGWTKMQDNSLAAAPVFFVIAGGAGTALALWLLRRLVRFYKAPLTFTVACRYVGACAAYLLAAAFYGGYSRLATSPVFLAFSSGAILVNLAFFFVVRIKREFAITASLALIPVLGLAIEFAFHHFKVVTSKTPFENPYIWLGVALAVAGVVLLQSDPASSSLDDNGECQ